LIRLAHFSRAASTDDETDAVAGVGVGAFAAGAGVSINPARSSSIAAARDRGGIGRGISAGVAAGAAAGLAERKNGKPDEREAGASGAMGSRAGSRAAGKSKPFDFEGDSGMVGVGVGSSAMIFRIDARISSIEASDVPSILLIARPVLYPSRSGARLDLGAGHEVLHATVNGPPQWRDRTTHLHAMPHHENAAIGRLPGTVGYLIPASARAPRPISSPT
jgi:hypothetical protein